MDDKGLWAGIGAVAGTLSAVLLRWWEKRDKDSAREIEERDRRDRSLFERQDKQLDACYARLREIQAECGRLEADRDRGWDLARAWNERAHLERHAHVNTIQVVYARHGDAAGAGLPPPEPLPPLHKLLPENGKPAA